MPEGDFFVGWGEEILGCYFSNTHSVLCLCKSVTAKMFTVCGKQFDISMEDICHNNTVLVIAMFS